MWELGMSGSESQKGMGCAGKGSDANVLAAVWAVPEAESKGPVSDKLGPRLPTILKNQ